MTSFSADSYSEADLEAEFDRLFPQGFAGPDVLQELGPGGWQNSPLLAVFHPSLAQTYEETLRFHRNSRKLRRPDDQRLLRPEPTLDEVAGEFRERPIEAEQEVRELVGECLWDVFSDSHEVVGPDGRVLDLGSFRASGGFLAEILNRQTGAEHYDYMKKQSMATFREDGRPRRDLAGRSPWSMVLSPWIKNEPGFANDIVRLGTSD